MRAGVPKEISEKVLELCLRIVPSLQPTFIAITPDLDCEPADCFANVYRKIQRKGGGRIQYGWALWEWPGAFIEAEHHAVYEPPTGPPWLDVTPCNRGSRRRLFLPDDSATYDFENEGVLRNNVRLALSDDPLIEELFKAAQKRSAFYNQLPGVGVISITAAEDQERQKIERRVARATLALAQKYGAK
jgi:hypothetical protein